MTWYDSTAFWTGAAAISTAVMALLTWRSIAVSQKQHRDARKQSERHHQDAYRPILVLAGRSGVDPLDRTELLRLDHTRSTGCTRVFALDGIVRNVGVGPALNPCMTVRVRKIEGYGASCTLTPLAVGGQIGDPDYAIQFSFYLQDGFNEPDAQFAAGEMWELLLEYEDVFGNRFHTIHSKNPQQPWTVAARGRRRSESIPQWSTRSCRPCRAAVQVVMTGRSVQGLACELR